jgi:hypothetical protein
MAILENVPRWLFASVANHFDENRQGLSMFVEGQHRATRTLKDFIELRFDGPYLTELSKGYWKVYVEINVLVQSAMDDENFHRIHTNVGKVAVAFSDIGVYKYGTGPDDDQSLLGCLKLVADARGKERIQISHFGKIAPHTEVLQATVEGHYEMRLTI